MTPRSDGERRSSPDCSATTDELVAEGDRIAERWTGWGTHRGEFQGIAPTGRQVTVPGTVFYRLASGKITEFRRQFDGLALMQQLGAIPDHQEIALGQQKRDTGVNMKVEPSQNSGMVSTASVTHGIKWPPKTA